MNCARDQQILLEVAEIESLEALGEDVVLQELDVGDGLNFEIEEHLNLRQHIDE